MNRFHSHARSTGSGATRSQAGFTLVEVLVVITIIGILAALSLPVIRNAMVRARNTAIRMDIEGIERGVNNYAGEYNDVPPDGSSWLVMNRHLNKAFPRISAVDRTLLYNMCHEPNITVPSNNPSGSVFFPTAIDRAEALVLFLGGLSSDESRPFTGPGGPFQFVGVAPGDSLIDPQNYQYNTDRTNARFDFDVTRLSLAQLPDPTQTVSTANRVVSSDDGDPIPKYFASGRQAPFVYFESRTYGYLADSNMAPLTPPYNGYADPNVGSIRPYKSKLNPPGAGSFNATNVAEAYRWQNPESFQVISAGQDDHFGNTPFNPADATLPAYFLTETGEILACNPAAGSGPAMLLPISGYQERTLNPAVENTNLDNLTNFNERLRMEDNLQD